MKEFAEKFYKSKTWQKCRIAYAKSVGGLCEICKAQGLVTPGQIVHHKIHVDQGTINDPGVLLNWDNLQLVCRECHKKIHEADIYPNKAKIRYKVDENGRVLVPPGVDY